MDEFTILKADEKRLVFGWASIAVTVDGEVLEDRQHDTIDPEDLEEAAYDYVLNFRDTGEEHLPGYRKKGKLVESVVLTKEKQRAMGIPEGVLPEGWWIGFYIEDDDAWERVKNGTYKMFSIEGKANREEVEKQIKPGSGVLVVKDGKILTGTRLETRTRGQICGPGGHIEAGETPAEAAAREAREEFGIECKRLKPIGVSEDGLSYFFMCYDFTGKPKTDDKEITDAKWRTPEELEGLKLFAPFEESLNHVPRSTEVKKFNPFHDSLGRFSNGNGYASFTIRTKDPKKQYMADMAAARMKEQAAQPAAQGSGDRKMAEGKNLVDDCVAKFASSTKSPEQKFNEILEMQGFKDKPQVVSGEELEAAAGEVGMIGYRTVNSANNILNHQETSAQEFAELMMNGEPNEVVMNAFGGKAYGEGLYTAMAMSNEKGTLPTKEAAANARDDSQNYGYTDDAKVMRLTLSPEAKVIDWEDLQKEFNSEPQSYQMAFDWKDNLYAAAKGYDAIQVTSMKYDQQQTVGYVVVLNRSAMIMDASTAGEKPWGDLSY